MIQTVKNYVFGMSSLFMSNPFISVWDTTKTGGSLSNQIRLPFPTATPPNDLVVDWGDGIIEGLPSSSPSYPIHTYLVGGVYTVKIYGSIKGFWQFANTGDRLKIMKIIRFGKFQFTNRDGVFMGCSNLKLNGLEDVPNTSLATTFKFLFQGCSNINPINNINLLNTSNVISMQRVFHTSNFNQSISNWDTSNVTSMEGMFNGNTAFNQDISMLNFSKVNDFSNFMSGKSSANYNPSYYSNLLIALDNAGKSNVTLGMGAIKYTSAGATARANLIAKGWTITDGGMI